MKRGNQRPLLALAGGLLGLVAARTVWLLSAAWPYDTDDAFITLRYARHWAEGQGIVWNPGGPPVEGYSNFLSLLLARVFLETGLEPLTGLKVTGVLALAGTSALLFRWSRRHLGLVGAAVPLLLVTAHPGQILWSVAGLESSLYVFLTVASVTAAVRALDDAAGAPEPAGRPDLRWFAVAGLLGLAASLARPEGVAVGLAVGAAALGTLLRRGQREPALRASGVLALTFAVPFAAYFLWRWGTFGRLLPNSVYCKAGFDADPYAILRDFSLDGLPLVAGALALPRRSFDAGHAAAALLTAFYVVAMTGADPLISFFDRYFLPVLALLTVPFAAGIVRLSGIVLRRAGREAREVAVALGVALGTSAGALVTHDGLEAMTARYVLRMQARTDLADALRERMRPGDWYVIGDAGIVPYRTGGRVVDAFCLNEPAMTRPPIDRSPERFLDDLFDRDPPFLVVHSFRRDRLDPRPEHDGVYVRMVERRELHERYEPEGVFGADGDFLHYWLFRRRSR